MYVQRKIPLRRFQSVRADVEVGHGNCAATRGIDREAAGKTERVQHPPAARQRFHLAAVLALVEKETGFLSPHHIRLKTDAVLGKNNRSAGHRLGQLRKNNFPITSGRRPAFRECLNVPAQAEHDAFSWNLCFELRKNFIQSRQPRCRVNFQGKRGIIAIQYQPRPTIAFAVNQTVAGGLRVKQTATAGERLFQPGLPPGFINRGWLAGVQDADADGRIGIEQSHGEKFIFAVEDDGEFA